MATEVTSGSLTASASTTITLGAAIQTAGQYYIEVDMTNAGDGAEGMFITRKAVKTGDAGRDYQVYGYGPADPGTVAFYSEPIGIATNESLTFLCVPKAGTAWILTYSQKKIE